jgi:hypothetical protein
MYNPGYDPEQDFNHRKQEIRKTANGFKSARAALYFVVGITILNMILYTIGTGWGVWFSAPVPEILYFTMVEMELPAVAALIAGTMCVGVYLVIALLSKRIRGLIIAALVLFSIETLIMLTLTISAFDFDFFIQFAICVVIFGALIRGVIAWRKLRGFSHEQLEAIYADIEADKGGTIQWNNSVQSPPPPVQGMGHMPTDSPIQHPVPQDTGMSTVGGNHDSGYDGGFSSGD